MKHITITDNETGDVLVDIDTNTIVALIEEGEGIRTVQLCNCNALTLGALAVGTQEVAKELREKLPDFLRFLIDAGDKSTTNE